MTIAWWALDGQSINLAHARGTVIHARDKRDGAPSQAVGLSAMSRAAAEAEAEEIMGMGGGIRAPAYPDMD